MSVLRAEYEGGSASFVKQIDWLTSAGFNGIRRTKGSYVTMAFMTITHDEAGDGDCFYRCKASLSSSKLRVKM